MTPSFKLKDQLAELFNSANLNPKDEIHLQLIVAGGESIVLINDRVDHLFLNGEIAPFLYEEFPQLSALLPLKNEETVAKNKTVYILQAYSN